MGLSSKQVNSSTSTDGLDCSHTFLQTQPNLQLPKTSSMRRVQQQQQQQQQNSELLKCPRCDSTNTKFCYYNNYNKTQPRHFCRACKRHWTKGGTLRNVPLGGGRKNKRTKKPTTSSSVSSALVSTQMTFQPQNQSQTLPLIYHQHLITTSEPFVQKQNLNFPFLSSSSFDSKLISVSNPSQTSSSSCFYNHVEELKFIEEPEICNIDMPNTNMMSTLTQQPIWQVPITSNSGIDMSNNWNWEDIDFDLVSTDINLAWDDSDIKP